jgi:hypothetical protein
MPAKKNKKKRKKREKWKKNTKKKEGEMHCTSRGPFPILVPKQYVTFFSHAIIFYQTKERLSF